MTEELLAYLARLRFVGANEYLMAEFAEMYEAATEDSSRRQLWISWLERIERDGDALQGATIAHHNKWTFDRFRKRLYNSLLDELGME